LGRDLGRDRLRATGRVCRLLRHDLAKPLNATALHLEVASRGLARLAGDGVEAIRASVRTSQAEVELASRLIDVLSELSQRVDHAVERFDLGPLLSRVVERARPGLSARGLSVVGPDARPALWLVGSTAEVEVALGDLLSGAASQASPGECRVSLDRVGAEARIAVRVPVRSPAPAPEALLALTGPSGGTSPGGGLLLVRWTFESLGGNLQAAVEGSSLVVTVAVPAEGG
jgi:signal transduction histidine kinase